MTVPVDLQTKTASVKLPLSMGWNELDGFTVENGTVTIDPQQYFFRYESPEWLICEWATVERDLLPLKESETQAVEQAVLEFIQAHGKSTTDLDELLRTAWQVNSFIFRDEHAGEPDLAHLDPAYFGMLREMGTVMAMNRVLNSGHIANVGPAWFFGIAAERVFGLSPAQGKELDDLYHGTFFNETRRVEALKANAALGGRLVHGCHSCDSMSGGCIVPFGADIDSFMADLRQFRSDWIDRIRNPK
jgi:hypothetical protein